jgi:hypothetical protein
VTIDPAAGDPRAQAPVLGHFGGGFSAKLSLGTNMTRPYLWMFMVEISVLNGVYKFYKPRNISLWGVTTLFGIVPSVTAKTFLST